MEERHMEKYFIVKNKLAKIKDKAFNKNINQLHLSMLYNYKKQGQQYLSLALKLNPNFPKS